MTHCSKMTLEKSFAVDSWSCKAEHQSLKLDMIISCLKRMGIGVMAQGATSVVSVLWGFLNTQIPETRQSASFCTWTVRFHTKEATALSAMVTHSRR